MPVNPRTLATPAHFGLGAASAVLGLLPWLITGARLPLQNLSAADSLEMPFGLLPFSQYFLTFTAAMPLVGAAVAGIIGRATAPRGRAAVWALIGGVAIVQVVALAQSAITVAFTLGFDRHRTAAIAYLLLVTGGILVSTIAGLGILTLIARAPKAGAVVALSLSAVAASPWLSGFLFPLNTYAEASPLTDAFGAVLHNLPALLVGAAIAWCGVNTAGRVVASVGSLALLVVGPALVAAVSSAAGSRVYAPYPAQMLDYGLSVLRGYLGTPDIWLPSLALAIGVAAIGLAGRQTVTRLRSQAEHPAAQP